MTNDFGHVRNHRGYWDVRSTQRSQRSQGADRFDAAGRQSRPGWEGAISARPPRALRSRTCSV